MNFNLLVCSKADTKLIATFQVNNFNSYTNNYDMSLPQYFGYSAYSQSFICTHSNCATSSTALYSRSDLSDDHIISPLNQKYMAPEDLLKLETI